MLARPALKLLAYFAITGGLVLGLVSGVTFLVTPEPGGNQEAHATPVIPTRIADSIERKKASLPQPEPVALPAPATPIMQEANVALTPALPQKFKIRELNAPQRRSDNASKSRHRSKRLPHQFAAQSRPPAPTCRISAGRRAPFTSPIGRGRPP